MLCPKTNSSCDSWPLPLLQMQLTHGHPHWPTQRARQIMGTLLHARIAPSAPHGGWPLTWERCCFLVTRSVSIARAVCRTRHHQGWRILDRDHPGLSKRTVSVWVASREPSHCLHVHPFLCIRDPTNAWHVPGRLHTCPFLHCIRDVIR